MWCVPALDDPYLAAMNDVLETYERPYHDQIPVVCFDEKCVELRADVRPNHRSRNGIRLRDYEYERLGTANVFVMTEPKGGRHFARVSRRRTRLDFAEALKFLADQYQNAITIHLVMDNLNTHNEASLIKRYGDYKGRALWARFTPHYTPKHASWLNQAEIAINVLSKAVLKGQRTPSIDALRRRAKAFFRERTQKRWTINWMWNRKRAAKWLENYGTRQ